MSDLPAQPNRSLMEGIEVLLAVAHARDPVRVRELARQLDMTPTRLQRYLATLAHLGFTAQDDQRRYGIGPGIHVLSSLSLSASGLASQALEVLPQLEDLGHTVALGVLWRETVSYLYLGGQGLAPAEALGRDRGFPARESSIGLLLLALGDPRHLEQYFSTEARTLRPQLKRIVKQGHATVRRSPRRASLAVPVGSPIIAGLAVSGNFTEKQEPKIIERLHLAAQQLTPEAP